jgi:hypothetical protein
VRDDDGAAGRPIFRYSAATTTATASAPEASSRIARDGNESAPIEEGGVATATTGCGGGGRGEESTADGAPVVGISIGAMNRYPRFGRVSMKRGFSAESPSVSRSRFIAEFRP